MRMHFVCSKALLCKAVPSAELHGFEVSPAGAVGAKRSPPESSAPSRAWKCEADGDKVARQPPRKVPLNTVFGGGWRGYPSSHEIMT